MGERQSVRVWAGARVGAKVGARVTRKVVFKVNDPEIELGLTVARLQEGTARPTLGARVSVRVGVRCRVEIRLGIN